MSDIGFLSVVVQVSVRPFASFLGIDAEISWLVRPPPGCPQFPVEAPLASKARMIRAVLLASAIATRL